MMTDEPQAIEVEVLEIDGEEPAVFSPTAKMPPRQAPWQNWHGRVRQLDSRWWPLWVVLGVIALALFLTVGVVVGVIVVIFRIITGILRAILR